MQSISGERGLPDRRFKLPEDDEELRRLAEKYSYSEIAKLYGVTKQAVSKRLLKEPHERLLPWQVTTEHSRFRIFKAAISYAKWRAGRQLTDDELAMAKELERVANTLNSVMVYSSDWGFQWRKRVPEDAPSILAKA